MGARPLQISSIKEEKVTPIHPSQSIEDIYGVSFAYNPKLYAKDYKHFSSDLINLEALTGRELSVAGDAPVVCHAGAATEPAMDLLRKAGLHVPSNRYTYRDDKEYIQILNRLKEENRKLIFQYPHPIEDVSPDLYWVDPDLLAYLCDKRNIPELVPKEHVPGRRMMSLEQILEEKPKLPIVVKTGDGRPTSGGCGVLLISEEKQLFEIDDTFGDLSRLIVEEHIDYDNNISVHFVVNKDGEISFLGKSEQLVNKDGCFRGSWISVDVEDDIADIIETGYGIMEKAAQKGYVGVAGFDVLIRGDQYYFIDLNVRFNASTCGLLLFNEIRNKYGKEIVRLCTLEWQYDFENVVPVVEKYMDQKRFVPLSLLDAGYFPDQNGSSVIIGLVLGHSVPEVEVILEELARDGLHLRE
ncbi:ATP-grasp domain-containing protein [Bacillus sp. V5-8f]|uniref:ATP-grasp domain-containing protein n=1 Tax=Bacillus sp. V5-8f TaxID=2053044 RepID=UPI000C761E88|nr:ATP-grasp domain-containing protein [Bacillus sp. V5-8f]PLT35416.1 hypothetical protein CUU64_02040 [Bacillus sp. V5-8f]